MSIPQICPCCTNHISEPHRMGCSFETPEYAHLGWPSYQVGAATPTVTGITEPHWGKLQDSATAIRRLLEYLNEEPEPKGEIVGEMVPNFAAITLLKKRAEELRKEAAGISLVEARAKRNFTADILDGLISELSE